jgi:hypothetical protein
MIKHNDFMGVVRKISPRLARALGDSITKQVEAGYRNEDLSLTAKGTEVVLQKLADQDEYNAALTEAAQADIDEAEKKKDCK